MAIPTSLNATTGASFTPSPTRATLSFLAFISLTLFTGYNVDAGSSPLLVVIPSYLGRLDRSYFNECFTTRLFRSEERRVGKSVSVRVDLGGRRIIKKKKTQINHRDKQQTKKMSQYRNNKHKVSTYDHTSLDTH